jgi:uncharacterized damage-inducible protein DinB
MRALIFLLLIPFLGCQERAERTHSGPEGDFKTEFRAIWDGATEYTLEVIDRMPEKEWDSSPADGSMSFRHQLFHIEGNLHGLTDRYILEKDSAFEVNEDSSVSKASMKERLKKAFEKVEGTLREMSEEELRDTTELFERMKVPKKRVFLLMRDHMTHHRGQMIIALRQAGKEPPEYRGW